MKRLLLVACLLGALVAPAPSRAADACAGTDDLAVEQVKPVDGHPRMRDYVLASDALERSVGLDVTTTRVLLPPNYDPTKSYPVLFLLHGAGDDHTSWTDRGNVETVVGNRQIVVVMPDAGKGQEAGWYSDWVDGPAWESYHVGELVPFVDGCFKTKENANGRALRAVTGLSMGGYGSFAYATRHPELWVAAGSFSGAVDNADGGPAQAAAYKAAHSTFGTPDERVWGDYLNDEVRWRDHNPVDLVGNLVDAGHAIWFSSGNGVPDVQATPSDQPQDAPAEAGVYPQNLLLHRALNDHAIGHGFEDQGRGTHAWRYWQEGLRKFLTTLDQALAQSASLPQRPETFDYRSAENAFEAWGYRVEVTREVREFLQLRDVSDESMVVVGTGRATITTAPVHEPGQLYSVETWYSTQTGGYVMPPAQRVTADTAGRIAFTVDMPSDVPHSWQQYTPPARVLETALGEDYWIATHVAIHRA